MTNPSVIAGLALTIAAPGRRMAPARINRPAPAPFESQAAGLKRQLDEIGDLLREQRERLAQETVGLAGVAAELGTYAPESPDAARSRTIASKNWTERYEATRGATAALELKAALLAEELQRYKETGVLSATPASTAERFKLLIENSRTAPPPTPEVPKLALDLATLQKQLRLGGRVDRRPAAAKRAATSIPSAKIADRTMFQRDTAAGKSEKDPIPGLIALLSSSNPRGRALAADELGSLGSEAAPAAAALKRALADPDRRVRASAALALGTAGDGSAAAELRRALLDPNEEVRLDARTALKRLFP